MFIDNSKVLVVTNQFEEMRKKLSDGYYNSVSKSNVCSSLSPSDLKVDAIYSAVDDLLKLLSECVMENEKNKQR